MEPSTEIKLNRTIWKIEFSKKKNIGLSNFAQNQNYNQKKLKPKTT